MNQPQHFALSLLFIFVAGLCCPAPAQTHKIEVTTERDIVRVTAASEVQEMRLQVFSPSGVLVYDSSLVAEQAVEWNMLDQQGQPVADGTYYSTITIKDDAGHLRQEAGLITLTREPSRSQQTEPAKPILESRPTVTPSDSTSGIAATGTGTAGRIVKWTGTDTQGNSLIYDTGSRIGLNTTAPGAIFHVGGTQPAAAPAGVNGTTAVSLINTSGGKGGNTTGTAGEIAGTGAGFILTGGDGGDAPAGGVNGTGGSLQLRPGRPGAGLGAAGKYGNVLLASGGGNVGIGTSTPVARLQVAGTIHSTSGGFKFPDGTTQTTAGGTGNFIQNRTTPQAGANFNISGNGTLGGTLSAVNVGIGTATASAGIRLEVNGAALITPGGSGGNIQFGTPSAETGMTVIGTNRADVRFDGSTLKLLAGTGRGVPASTSRVVINTAGNVGIGTTSPKHHLSVIGGPEWTFNRWAGALELGNASAIGWQSNGSQRFGIGQSGGGLYFFRTTSDPGTMSDAANYVMTLSDAGNVHLTGRLFLGLVERLATSSQEVCIDADNMLIRCTSPSSRRFKTDVQTLSAGLEVVRRLRPVTFRWKSDGVPDLGLIAEEVAAVEPLLAIHDEQGVIDGVKYRQLNMVLINAIKEQQQQIELQQTQLKQQQQIKSLQKVVRRIMPKRKRARKAVR